MKNSTALRLNRIFPVVLISALFFVNDSASAQSGNKYATGLNSLTATDGLGSYNYEGLNFYTNAVKRGAFTKDGEFEALYKAHFYADLKCDSIIKSWKAQTDNLRVFGNAVIDSTLQAQRLEADALSIAGNANISDTLSIGLLTLTGNRISSSNGTISFSGNNLVKAGTLIATTVDAQTYLLSGTAIDFNAMDSTDKALQVQIDSIETAVGSITSSQWQNTSPNSISYTGNATVNGTFQANNINTALLTISDKFTAPKGEFDTLRAERQLSINHNLKLGRDSGSTTESDIASKIDVLKIQSDPNMSFDVVMAEGNEAKIGIGVKEGLTAKLNVLGGTRLNGDLQVTGNSTFNGDIFSQGTIEANTINASNINLNGTPFSGQFLRLSGDTMKGNITFDNNSSLNHSSSNGLLRFNNTQGENIIGLGYNMDDPATQQGFLIAPSGYKGNPNGSFAFGDANPNGQIILALGTGQSGTRINLDGAGKRLILQNDGGDKFSMGGVNALTLLETTQGINVSPRSGFAFTGTHLLDIQGSVNAQQYYINGNPVDVAGIDSTLDTLQAIVNNFQSSQWQNDTANPSNIFYSAGNVGIGVSNPSEMLEINGRVRISGLSPADSSGTPKDSSGAQIPDTLHRSIIIDGGIDRIIATSGTLDFGNTNLTTTGSFQSSSITTANLSIIDKIESDTMHARRSFEVNSSIRLSRDTSVMYAEMSTKDTAVALMLQKEPTAPVVIGDAPAPPPGESRAKLTVVGNTKLDGNMNVSGGITANCVTTSCLNVNGQTSFDSLHASNTIKIGNSIHIDGVGDLLTTNNIWTSTAAPTELLIQSKTGLNHNTIINANNIGNVGIGSTVPEEKLDVFGNAIFGDGVFGNGITLRSNAIIKHKTSSAKLSFDDFLGSPNIISLGYGNDLATFHGLGILPVGTPGSLNGGIILGDLTTAKGDLLLTVGDALQGANATLLHLDAEVGNERITLKNGVGDNLQFDGINGSSVWNSPLGIQLDGNVGIGTATLSQKLNVNGDINVEAGGGYRINNAAPAGQYLRGDGTRFSASAIDVNDIPPNSSNYIQNQTGTAQSGGFNISGNGTLGGNAIINGNVGIGTASPNYHLNIYNPSTGILQNSTIQLTNNTSGNTALDGVLISSGYNNASFSLLENGLMNFIIGQTPLTAMTIKSSGFVGIGGDPQDKFHVFGNGIFEGNVSIGSTTASEKLEVDGSVKASSLAGSGDRLIMADASGKIIPIVTGTSDQVLLGNGTWGTVPANTIWSLTGNSATNPATHFIGTTDAQDFVFKTNNTERMRITSTGEHPGLIGIGTSNPEKAVHIKTYHALGFEPPIPACLPGSQLSSLTCPETFGDEGSSHNGIRLDDVTTFAGGGTIQSTWDLVPAFGRLIIGKADATASDYNDIIGTQPKVIITAEGNVGIGTDPVQTLDVNGSGHFAGNVGIGTTNPGAELEIRSSGLFAGNTLPLVKTTGTAGAGWRFNAGAKEWAVHATGTSNNQGADKMVFKCISDSTTPMTLISTGPLGNGGFGKVGIGTTAPKEQLQIGNTFTFHNGGNKVIARNFYYNSDDKRIEQGSASAVYFGDGSLGLNVATDGNADSHIDWIPAINISSNVPPGANYVAAIGMGTNSKNVNLTVHGHINACEVIVEEAVWCDYVFTDNYSLMPLDKLEKYLKDNKHLPKIPPASIVEKNGINLGEMNKMMMEKIEELTLYIIEQDKRIKELEEMAGKQNKQ